MRKYLITKILCLVIALLILMPIMFNSEAEAGTQSREYSTYSNLWLFTSNIEKDTGGNRSLVIQTYIKNSLNQYVESPYEPAVTIKYSGDPGSSSVTVDDAYDLSHMELWNQSIKEMSISNGSINIQIARNSTKVLKIFLNEKFANEESSDPTNITGGEVTLNKTATSAVGNSNEFDLEFSVQGTEIKKGKTADIILVFDKSGSMKESIGNKTKALVLEEAANKFIDAVLPIGKATNNRVAIVTYSGPSRDDDNIAFNDSQILQTFTSNNDTAKSKYKNYVNMVNGGTNSEAGFIAARRLFGTSARSGAERFVIYMTDGEPTQYYDENGDSVGLGSEYDINAKNRAIAEANLLKEFGGNGVKIYTVGLASKNTAEMEALLNPSADAYQAGYYHATTANDLNNIYNLLADTIIKTIANDVKVKDALPKDFEFLTNSLPNGVTVSADGKMEWNIGSITTNKSSQKIRVRYTGDKYGILYSNKDAADISYKHSLSPNKITERKFDNTLSIVTPNISEYVYYVNKGETIIINPPDIKMLNEGGSDYTISDLRIKVDTGTKKPNGQVSHNADNTQITYIPQSQGYTEDSFSYTVYFTVSSKTDSKNLIEGTSTTFEKKVNVIVNPHPNYSLTINYYEIKDGSIKPLFINGAKSIVKMLPRDAIIDEFAPNVTGYDFVRIESKDITNPLIRGRRITGNIGSKNATINFYYESDGTLIENILMNNSMYKNNELQSIGDSLKPYSVIPGINYRFGFKFQAGMNIDLMNMAVASNKTDYSLSDFRLYDENGVLLNGPVNDFALLKPYIATNGIYTVTYNIKSNSDGLNLNVTINNSVPQTSTVSNQLTINSIMTPILE